MRLANCVCYKLTTIIYTCVYIFYISVRCVVVVIYLFMY